MFWHARKTGRGLILASAAGLAMILCVGGVLLFGHYKKDSRLLKADPDGIPAQQDLMAYAEPRGAGIFADRCAACHHPDGRGDPSLGAPNLTDKDWLYGSGMVSEIRQTVEYGIRSHDTRGRDLADMPAYARAIPYTREKLPPLSPDDIHDVVEFLFLADGRTADGAAAQRGVQIFQGRGGCWDCHGNDGRGDSAVGAPNLMDQIWLYGSGSRRDVFASIADGHQGVCPAWVDKLSPAQILQVSLYVWSLSHGGAAPQ